MNPVMNPIERRLESACVASMHYPNAVWIVMAKGLTVKVTSTDFMALSYERDGYKIVARFKNGKEI